MTKLARPHDKTLSHPPITKSLSEEIIHRAGLANRSEGRNNEGLDAPEPVGDLAHRGLGEWTVVLRIFGPGGFSRSSNVSWRASWLGCCCSCYPEEDWIAT